MNPNIHHRGFTLFEVAIVILVIAVLVAVVLTLSPSPGKRRPMRNSTQQRGIHQGLVTFAQSNKTPTGDGVFAGLAPDRVTFSAPIEARGELFGSGGRDGSFPQTRYAMLLNGGYFTPEYMIHEKDAGFKTPAAPGTDVTPANFSYAMLRLDTELRRGEWAETINSNAVVLSDRNVGTVDEPASRWMELGSGPWAGAVTSNDGSTVFYQQAVVENTRYSGAGVVALDHLFRPDDQDDRGETTGNAAMVYATDRDHENQK